MNKFLYALTAFGFLLMLRGAILYASVDGIPFNVFNKLYIVIIGATICLSGVIISATIYLSGVIIRKK